MPMTQRQLDQVEDDYRKLVPPGWTVIGVEGGWKPTIEELQRGCAICGEALWDDPYGASAAKRITYQMPRRTHPTHVSIIACRNGVRCRARVEEKTT